MSRPAAPQTTSSISPRALTLLAFVAFISLGLPDTLLGVAWPSIRGTFALPISDLGYVLACGAVGYLISSFLGGEIVRRLGVGKLLIASTLLVVIALAGSAATPVWPGLMAFAFVGGLGAGAIDAGINTFAASKFSPRVVNWLHACWGIGASSGPLLMTAVIAAGHSWRIGYGIVAAVMTVMCVLFVRTRAAWRLDTNATAFAHPTATIAQALCRPVVLAQMLFYLVYGGLESGAGQWLFTFLTASRGASVATAGSVVGGYWAAITVGRIAFGQIAGQMTAVAMIRIGLIGSICAVALVWASGPLVMTIAGVVMLGFSLAPVFPTLLSDTPRRVGVYFAPQAVGFQVAGAAIGIALIPGLIGGLARRSGIDVLPPCLFAAAIALAVLHEAIVRAVKPPAV